MEGVVHARWALVAVPLFTHSPSGAAPKPHCGAAAAPPVIAVAPAYKLPPPTLDSGESPRVLLWEKPVTVPGLQAFAAKARATRKLCVNLAEACEHSTARCANPGQSCGHPDHECSHRDALCNKQASVCASLRGGAGQTSSDAGQEVLTASSVARLLGVRSEDHLLYDPRHS